MKIKGIKREKAIELSQEINIPDGQEVNIEIQVIQNMSNEEKLQKMKEFLENLSDEDREEWAKIGEFLEKERQLDRVNSDLASVAKSAWDSSPRLIAKVL